MPKLLITYLISLVLISHSMNKLPPLTSKRAAGPAVKGLVTKLEKRFDRPELARLVGAFCFGLKRSLPRKIRTPFKELNLQHLFTPSGLHLSSFLLLLSPFYLFVKRKRRFRLKKITHLVISLIPFLLGPYYSLQRIGELRFFSIIFKKFDFSPYVIFLITFALDFIFGTYKHSPLSYSYSFLFLGVIFACWDRGKLALISGLAGAQLLINVLQYQYFHPLAPVINFILSSIFTLIFPVLVIGITGQFNFFIGLTEQATSFYFMLVSKATNFLITEIAFAPSFWLIIALFCLMIRPYRATLGLAILMPTTALNLPLEHYQREVFKKYKSQKIFASPLSKRSNFEFGDKTYYKNGGYCSHKILNTRHDNRCRLKRHH